MFLAATLVGWIGGDFVYRRWQPRTYFFINKTVHIWNDLVNSRKHYKWVLILKCFCSVFNGSLFWHYTDDALPLLLSATFMYNEPRLKCHTRVQGRRNIENFHFPPPLPLLSCLLPFPPFTLPFCSSLTILFSSSFHFLLFCPSLSLSALVTSYIFLFLFSYFLFVFLLSLLPPFSPLPLFLPREWWGK